MTAVKLESLCDIQSGGTPPRGNADSFGGEIPWVKISDIEASNGIVTSTEETISETGLKAIRGRLFPRGTLLFAIYGSVGKSAFAGVDLSANQAVLGIQVRDRESLSSRYLYHWLKSKQNTFESDASGIAQKNLSAGYVRSLEILLPPLGEQKRIAEILDQADELRRKRQRALDRLNQLGQAIFIEMFGDPATNPMHWPMGTIRELLDEAKYGTSAKANTDGVGLPVLRMGNLTYDGKIDLSDMKHVELADDEFDKYTTRPGDILFNRTNSKELVGKTAVVTQAEPFAIAGYLVRARVNDRGNPHYISAYLNSRHGKATLRNMCKNIVGMANINAQEFQNIAIAIPPKEIQDGFAARISSTEGAGLPMSNSQSRITVMFASLQHCAFSGEL